MQKNTSKYNSSFKTIFGTLRTNTVIIYMWKMVNQINLKLNQTGKFSYYSTVEMGLFSTKYKQMIKRKITKYIFLYLVTHLLNQYIQH